MSDETAANSGGVPAKSDGPANALPILLDRLNAGVVQQIASAALLGVCKAVNAQEKGGKMDMSFSIKPSKGDESLLEIETKLSYKLPTSRGTRSEDMSMKAMLYLKQDGTVAYQPESQSGLFEED